jgi:CubicO group peptidase (beta-lactamase class C family)
MCLSAGGELDGVRLLRPGTLAEGRRELARRWDPLVRQTQVFGLGFQLQTSERHLGPPADAFGHSGAGGSVHCAWPEQRLGLSYAMNVLRDDRPVDPRSDALLTALYEALP